MSKELQHWLDRNRPPRVQITYDVETLGATVKQEIPFIVGIIGDFAGGARPESDMGDRTFVEIDRDNFKQVMEKLGPSLQLGAKPLYQVVRTPEGTAVQDSPSQSFPVTLAFNTMDDFAPSSLIRQVPALAAVMQTRQTLSDLIGKLGTDPALEKTLWTNAAGPALAAAKADMAAAHTALTDATTGAKKLFDDAATAVLAVQTADPDKTSIKNAQDAATTALGDASGGYTQAFTAAGADKATQAEVQAAAAAGWQLATVLRDGLALLTRITSANPGADDAGKKAQDAVTAAKVPVASSIAKAGQAVRSTASAAALAATA